jgi:hypothetical protein
MRSEVDKMNTSIPSIEIVAWTESGKLVPNAEGGVQEWD